MTGAVFRVGDGRIKPAGMDEEPVRPRLFIGTMGQEYCVPPADAGTDAGTPPDPPEPVIDDRRAVLHRGGGCGGDASFPTARQRFRTTIQE
jgi:hypothetical protein